jgi:hypothetical protein
MKDEAVGEGCGVYQNHGELRCVGRRIRSRAGLSLFGEDLFGRSSERRVFWGLVPEAELAGVVYGVRSGCPGAGRIFFLCGEVR